MSIKIRQFKYRNLARQRARRLLRCATPRPSIMEADREKDCTWTVTDHACSACGGRVLVQRDAQAQMSVRCAECGRAAKGGNEALCYCGAHFGELGRAFECVRNLQVTDQVPYEVLVRERDDNRS